MRSKIPKNSQNRIEIQDNTSKGISIELLNNRENSNKISTTEHLTKSTNHKTEATEIEERNSTPENNYGRNYYGKLL